MTMRLFNTIITYDVYCLAETEEAARATIRQAIRTPTENPEAEGRPTKPPAKRSRSKPATKSTCARSGSA